ncbi:lysosome membrane protein 2 [Eurytemora carolleeae]|uniref:lysosome membrane protein 2 n=1 Tax=Eurytemora carolleeae TaxID=1294199 RepID=UPI000C75DAD2|nr:lysosome membrane protein 2 [Eurytemora carolleeae]|eukprot:XP_023345389.1 lysosome membrane protein 2-like [Eurytemora affinis]
MMNWFSSTESRTRSRTCTKTYIPLQILSIIALGFFGWSNLDNIIRNQINSELIVKTGGALYHLWSEPPIHPVMKVYVFNVTNKDEWLAGQGRVKLKLDEIGPLVYRETWWKTNVKMEEGGDVSYDLVKRFDPVPEKFGCDPNSLVILPNIPLFSGAARMKGQNELTVWAFQSAIEMFESKLFVSVPVKDILWGYEEPLLVGATMVLPEEEIRKPGYFGLMAGRNMSSDGRISVRGGFGSEGLSNLGGVTSWKERSEYTSWGSDECNSISGGEGSQFPPSIKPDTRLGIFIPDICRKLPLVFDKTETISGVETLRFQPDPQAFNYLAPENKCYCVSPANCTDNGVFYVSPCKYGAPLVVSWPHFLDAPQHADKVEGLTPVEEKHRFYMNIQPQMGMGLSAKVRLQINLDIMKAHEIPFFSSIPEDRLLVPIMWFEDSIDTPPENLLIILRDALGLPDNLSNGFLTVCIGSVSIQLYTLIFLYIVLKPNLDDVMFGVEILSK